MTKLPNCKVLFVSHSSRDREIVNAFTESFLYEDDREDGTALVNTSADDPSSTARLIPGESVWRQLRENLGSTGCFIACLSDNYFKSNWCIAELAVFHEKLLKKKKNLLFIPLLIDPDSKTWKESPFTQSSKVLQLSKADDLEELTANLKLAGLLKSTAAVPRGTTCTAFSSTQLNEFLNSREESEKGYFIDLAQGHFAHAGASHGPVSCLVKRTEYGQICVNMAERAKSKLLWTLFKSPLLVAPAYDETDSLMVYDRKFSKFKTRRKKRVVIFEDPEMAAAYDKLDVGYHDRRFAKNGIILSKPLTDTSLALRKKAFEKTASENGGELLFTVLSRLPKCFPHGTKHFNERSYLEFAFSDYDGPQRPWLLLESGFNSEFSNKHITGTYSKSGLQFGHVTFSTELPPLCSEAIDQCNLYGELYGHLRDLHVIADAIFDRNVGNNDVFVPSSEIKLLY